MSSWRSNKKGDHYKVDNTVGIKYGDMAAGNNSFLNAAPLKYRQQSQINFATKIKNAIKLKQNESKIESERMARAKRQLETDALERRKRAILSRQEEIIRLKKGGQVLSKREELELKSGGHKALPTFETKHDQETEKEYFLAGERHEDYETRKRLGKQHDIDRSTRFQSNFVKGGAIPSNSNSNNYNDNSNNNSNHGQRQYQDEHYDDRASDYQDVEQPRYNKQSIIPDHDKVRGNAAVSVKAGKPKG